MNKKDTLELEITIDGSTDDYFFEHVLYAPEGQRCGQVNDWVEKHSAGTRTTWGVTLHLCGNSTDGNWLLEVNSFSATVGTPSVSDQKLILIDQGPDLYGPSIGFSSVSESFPDETTGFLPGAFRYQWSLFDPSGINGQSILPSVLWFAPERSSDNYQLNGFNTGGPHETYASLIEQGSEVGYIGQALFDWRSRIYFESNGTFLSMIEVYNSPGAGISNSEPVVNNLLCS